MRILILITSLGIGGAEKQAIRIAEGLVARGNEVLVLALLSVQANEWPTTLRTIHLDARKTPLGLFRTLFRARKIIADFKPHIVHSHTFPANLFARILKLISRHSFKLVSTIHNVYEGGRVRMSAYRLTDFLSDQTTAVSRAAAARFAKIGAVPVGKMLVLTNGIDPDEFSPVRLRAQTAWQKGREFIWFSAGRIIAAKDYPNLLRAFAHLRAEEPSSRLRIAGEGSNDGLARLSRLAEELGIADYIDWLGLRADLPRLMAECDGFVLSSAWEGMPLVLGEAMAMELPVVATDVGGVRELVGDCAHIVAAHDPAALAQAMLAVQRAPEEVRHAIGRSSRARIADDFNLHRKISEWSELYAKLLTNRASLSLRAPLFTAATLRLLFLLLALLRTGISAITSGDSLSYLLPGLNLVHTDRFFSLSGPELDRTPGYPLFLALATAPGFLFAVLIQIAISIASIWIAARIARRIFAGNPRAGRIAALTAWLLAFEPLSIAYSIKLYPETIFVFLLLLALHRLLHFFYFRTLASLAQAAILLAAAAYVKPIAYYLPLLIAILLSVFLRKTPRLRWQAPLLTLTLAALLLAPWQLRNWRLSHFCGFSTIQQKNLYFFQAAGVLAESEHRPFEEVRRSLGYGDNAAYHAAHPEQSNWQQSAVVAYQGNEALRILRAHPFTAAFLQLKGSTIVAFSPGAADLFALLGAPPRQAPAHLATVNAASAAIQFARRNPAHSLLMLTFAAYLFWLHYYALLTLFKSKMKPVIKTTLYLIAAYFLILAGGAQAVARYRLPFMPILCLLAAGALVPPRLSWFIRGQDDYNAPAQ